MDTTKLNHDLGVDYVYITEAFIGLV